MAYILIDGYNLTGIDNGNLEKARNELIESLRHYCEIKKHKVTVVFDGWKNGRSTESITKNAGLTVIYTRLGEIADVAIRKMLTPDARPWIVISTDREIYDYAGSRGFAAVTSEEFERKLFNTLKDHLPEETQEIEKDVTPATMEELLEQSDTEFLKYINDETDNSSASSSGNPRKLSKKDRKKIQALSKL